MPLFVVVWPLVPFPLHSIFKIDIALLPTQEGKNDSNVWLSVLFQDCKKQGLLWPLTFVHLRLAVIALLFCLSSSHLHPIAFPLDPHAHVVTTTLSPIFIHVFVYTEAWLVILTQDWALIDICTVLSMLMLVLLQSQEFRMTKCFWDLLKVKAQWRGHFLILSGWNLLRRGRTVSCKEVIPKGGCWELGRMNWTFRTPCRPKVHTCSTSCFLG